MSSPNPKSSPTETQSKTQRSPKVKLGLVVRLKPNGPPTHLWPLIGQESHRAVLWLADTNPDRFLTHGDPHTTRESGVSWNNHWWEMRTSTLESDDCHLSGEGDYHNGCGSGQAAGLNLSQHSPLPHLHWVFSWWPCPGIKYSILLGWLKGFK